jgi:N-acetylmuramoyl-L-alanine amidase
VKSESRRLSPVWACALIVTFCIETAFAATASAQVALQGRTCDKASFGIAIDVGHSSDAPGATSARGVSEFKFNLALSNAIHQSLRGRGFSRVRVMRSSGSGSSSLVARGRKATQSGADVLLSVHHDSVQPQFLRDGVVDGRKSRYSTEFEGYSLFISQKNRHSRQSLRLAHLIGRRLKSGGLSFSTHHSAAIPGENRRIIDRDAGVYSYNLTVLSSVDVPAVLIEAGVIVNPNEELALTSPGRRSQMAWSISDALEQFCAEQGKVAR